MKIGSTYTKDRQRYECVGFDRYTNRCGHSSLLIVLETGCATCSERFQFMLTKGRLKQRAFSRRCALHKKPASPLSWSEKRLRDYRDVLSPFA